MNGFPIAGHLQGRIRQIVELLSDVRGDLPLSGRLVETLRSLCEDRRAVAGRCAVRDSRDKEGLL
jgi:hypothetical protein